jgi:hypothetical protein
MDLGLPFRPKNPDFLFKNLIKVLTSTALLEFRKQTSPLFVWFT